jgi:hypothetical protein
MVPIDWHPAPRDLRRWAVAMLIGTALGGAVFHFLLDHPAAARILWGFGAISFATGITGTIVARPFYLLWMGFVWTVSTTLGTLALAFVFYCVVTPIGLLARLAGRDRLHLRRPPPDLESFWEKTPTRRADRFERPF